MAEAITEEMNLQEKWFEEARKMTWENLPEFLRHLMEDYKHDYGTICHALSAGAVATAWAMNSHKQGGITGFQSGFVMWGFIRNWTGEKGPQRLLRYDNMLYPQYETDFEKAISKHVWEHLQQEAAKKMADPSFVEAHPKVYAHVKSITEGAVPFGYTVEG